MLTKMRLENFTVFSDSQFEFGENLNVFVGENGSGKTHILKAAYSTIYVCNRGEKTSSSDIPTKAYLQKEIAQKLTSVFKPDSLGRLTRRNRQGRQRCEIDCQFSRLEENISFSFNTSSKSEVSIDNIPLQWGGKLPVYLPTRELLTIYPGFVSLYETTHLPFEETWRDTCILLGAPLAKGPRGANIKQYLEPLEEAMGGNVVLNDAGRFYLVIAGVIMEMHLVAEGLRKLAMIARLIATGALVDKGYLFWDEPEANLNPKIIKVVARTILHLSQSGIQIFIASHSLFLIRELDILLQTDEFNGIKCRFFGLHPSDNGILVSQGDTVDDIGDIDALNEELTQSDRYLNMEDAA